jgi:hypothetical protein
VFTPRLQTVYNIDKLLISSDLNVYTFLSFFSGRMISLGRDPKLRVWLPSGCAFSPNIEMPDIWAARERQPDHDKNKRPAPFTARV